MKKRVATVLILVAFVVLGYWIWDGTNIFTQTAVLEPVKDELFGTTTMEWRDEFRLGLDYAGPVAGVFGLIATVLLWLDRKKKRSLSASG